MPIYDFECQKCGHAFELLIQCGEVGVCPECASKRLEKKLSLFATGTGSRDIGRGVCPSSGQP